MNGDEDLVCANEGRDCTQNLELVRETQKAPTTNEHTRDNRNQSSREDIIEEVEILPVRDDRDNIIQPQSLEDRTLEVQQEVVITHGLNSLTLNLEHGIQGECRSEEIQNSAENINPFECLLDPHNNSRDESVEYTRRDNPNVVFAFPTNNLSHEEVEFLELLSSAWAREEGTMFPMDRGTTSMNVGNTTEGSKNKKEVDHPRTSS